EHGRMVYGVCRLLLRDREEAEDAAQQTFLSAYRSLLTGAEPREPAAWLGTIARNECRARVRARMATPLVPIRDDEGPTDELEHLAGRREEIGALCEALAELPHHQRQAVVLREFYGLSHEEVGHALGVTPSAVDSLLVRARRRLQAELRPARLASGALVLPLALRESLAQAMPGFASGSGASGALAKLLSLPAAAKLAGAAATVVVVGGVGAAEPRGTDVPGRTAVPAVTAAALAEASAPERTLPRLVAFSSHDEEEREHASAGEEGEGGDEDEAREREDVAEESENGQGSDDGEESEGAEEEENEPESADETDGGESQEPEDDETD
ncbi:MAG: RNA polymerase sigma factor, partial [Gaiellaceae bacterium]